MASDDIFPGYFDWAATTPGDQTILQNALTKTCTSFANPSSVHKEGLQAKALLSDARKRCAVALGVKETSLIFTSGGTESDHWPIVSLLQRPALRNSQSRGNIVISAIEHPAIREMAESMKNCGFNIISVLPEKDGRIDAEKLLEKVDDETLLVCVMAVNNETGCIQPVYQIADGLKAKFAGKKKPKFHVDAVQTIGKVPFFPAYPGIDSAAFSGHKLRGPRGIGLLYLSQRQEPFMRGGEQESSLRPGTENLFGALAIAECLERYALTPKNAQSALACAQTDDPNVILQNVSNQNAARRYCQQIEYTFDFLENLKKLKGTALIPQVRGETEKYSTIRMFSPWIVQASFENIPGEVMVRALSEKGFSISTGSACSSRKLSRPILEAMGVKKDQSANAVRFSFGCETRNEDMKNLLAAIAEIRSMF